MGDHGPVALDSKLGWLLSGPLNDHSKAVTTHSHVIIHGGFTDSPMDENSDHLISTLQRLWNVESLGILDKKHEHQLPMFLQTILFNNNQYEVGLPWKEGHPYVPNHFNVCLNRLRLLHRRLLGTPELDRIIQEKLSKGIVESVPSDSLQDGVHYLPHHGVIRWDKQTTKLRIVYNGSMRLSTDAISLNDCLKTVPNLILKLFNVLIKFRWHLVILTADIEKAFFMIRILSDDRDMLRFLWLEDPFDIASRVLELRFTRLVFGLWPSPAILGTVISQHLDRYQSKHPELIQFIKDSFYVDDLITGGETIEDAFHTFQVAKQALAEGGFNMRKRDSNSPELRDKIASELGQTEETTCTERATSHLIGANNTQGIDQLQTKLLGIFYDSQADEFTFCFSDLTTQLSKLPANCRSLLKITASIFDPLGLLSPFVIRLKILFQTLYSQRIEWDHLLEGKHLRWRSSGRGVPLTQFAIYKQVAVSWKLLQL